MAVVKGVAISATMAVTTAEVERYGGGGNSYGGGNGGGRHSDHGRHHRVITVTVDGTVLSGGAGANFILTATSSTLRSLKGTAVTVDVTSSTTYKQPGVTSPSVTTGDFVVVTGTETSTAGTITAESVLIPAVQLTGYVVTGGAGANFTLTTTSTTIFGPKATTVTINVNVGGITTKYKEKGVESPSVAVGDKVQVTGNQAGTNTVNATLVVITAPPPRHHHYVVPIAYGHGSNGGGSGFGGGNGDRGRSATAVAAAVARAAVAMGAAGTTAAVARAVRVTVVAAAMEATATVGVEVAKTRSFPFPLRPRRGARRGRLF